MSQHVGCLKYSLNRVVFRTARTMTNHDRLQRYHQAVITYPPPKQCLRQQIGANLQDAWKVGKRPNLRLIARALKAL